MIEVTGLYVYPVKSLRGIALQQCGLNMKGLRFDRHWMVVLPNGQMVTQRVKPLMARLATSLTDDSLMITALGQQPLEVPQVEREGLELVDVTVWLDRFQALDEGVEVSNWLTKALESQHPLRLVRMSHSINRPQSKPDLLGETTSTRFADAAPVLVANENSLAALNHRLQNQGLSPVVINRFRPNIVVKGLDSFQEYVKGRLIDKNGRYSIGLKYPSERCVIVNTDHETGEVDRELQQPLTTLREMNTAPNLKGAYFGQNAVIEKGDGEKISIGDRLILETE